MVSVINEDFAFWTEEETKNKYWQLSEVQTDALVNLS